MTLKKKHLLYSTDVQTDAPMTLISGQEERDLLSEAVLSLVANGGTCLSLGVLYGLEVLSERSTEGGVMIFITDGEYACNPDPDDDYDLNNEEFLAIVEESGVRIITIAFSDNADESLENLALVTNGKTYFIPDGNSHFLYPRHQSANVLPNNSKGQGVEDINDALEGSLTYQPAEPTENLDIVILSETYSNFASSSADDVFGGFVVDVTLGRDVAMEIDYGTSSDVTNVRLFDDAGAALGDFSSTVDEGLMVYRAEFGNLTDGTYQFGLETDGAMSFATVVVTSKAQVDTLPFETRCWINSANEDVNLEEGYLAVFAEVTQEGNPVLHALVEAVIEKEGEEAAIQQELLDDGSDADLTANDGIYSRYKSYY